MEKDIPAAVCTLSDVEVEAGEDEYGASSKDERNDDTADPVKQLQGSREKSPAGCCRNRAMEISAKCPLPADIFSLVLLVARGNDGAHLHAFLLLAHLCTLSLGFLELPRVIG